MTRELMMGGARGETEGKNPKNKLCQITLSLSDFIHFLPLLPHSLYQITTSHGLAKRDTPI